MLDSVKLHNFKCYQEQEFSLSNLTVFCGNNSVGKSTAIQALLLGFQNNFSLKLELSGDFIELGTYQDIHNRDSDSDSLLIEIQKENMSLKWGYENEEFDNEKRKKIDDMPLPIIAAPNNELIIKKWNELYNDNFVFLSAERWGPRSNYPYSSQRRSLSWPGVHGEFTPQVLSTISTTDVLIEGDARIHKEASGRTLADSLYAWMSEISPGVFIKSDSIKHASVATNQFIFGGHTYRAANVGFGLSYVLPVVLSLLMAKPNSLLIIENPEAHLHPRGQSYLGRLIARTAESGVQIIIETHSDHLLNGIRVAASLSETYQDGLAKIFYVSAGDEESNVEELLIDSNGEIPYWPNGFFDQQALDIQSIMMGENITDMPSRRTRERK